MNATRFKQYFVKRKEKKQKKEELSVENTLQRIADSYKTKNIIYRGLINGIFTAVGATVGFAVFILILAKLYSGISNLPIINSIMQATGLDQVVEYALQQSGQNDISVSDDGSDN